MYSICKLTYMRKLAISIILSLFCLTLSAQNFHEIELGVGAPVGGIYYNGDGYGYYSDTRRGNTLTDLYEDVEYHTSKVCFNLDYSYALKKWLRVGVETCFAQEEVTIRKGLAYVDDNPIGKGITHLSVMPMVKIPYWDGMWANAYGRVSVGAELATDWGDSWKGRFAWEVVPFGLCCGKHNFKIIYEIGVGTIFIGRYGICVQF